MAYKKSLDGFLKRNPELAKRTSTHISRVRSLHLNCISATKRYIAMGKVLQLYGRGCAPGH